MRRPKPIAVALTIAGSDSGGGAGIQADLRAFAALGVHGATAITCITAQNPKELRAVQPLGVAIVRRQLEAVFAELPPAAVKTGMLYSPAIIQATASFLARHSCPLVVDPVMIATSGAPLLMPAAMKALTAELLLRATLVTPNLSEAEVLTGTRLRTVEDLRGAARDLHRRFGCAALVKGGHLRGLTAAVDIFYDGKAELLLTAPFVKGVRTHGTGCTFSAAVTAGLARGDSLVAAVRRAKQYITRAIASSRTAHGHTVLG